MRILEIGGNRWTAVPMLVEAETNHANRSLIVGLPPLRTSIQPYTDSHRFTGFSPRTPGQGPDRCSRADRNQLLMNSTPCGFESSREKTDSCVDSDLARAGSTRCESLQSVEIGGRLYRCSQRDGDKPEASVRVVGFRLHEYRYSRPPISTDFKDSHRGLPARAQSLSRQESGCLRVNCITVRAHAAHRTIRCALEQRSGPCPGVLGENPVNRWESVDAVWMPATDGAQP